MPTSRLTLAHPLSVLSRPDGALQLGLDSDAAVVVPRAPAGADAALRALRQPRTTLEVSRLVPSVPHAWLRGLAATLLEKGLLRESTAAAPVPRVRVLGTGTLRDEVARTLEAEGWQVAPPSGPPTGTDVAVLCPPTAEPDRVLARELTASGLPHLVVRAEPERAVVGPFVDPGRTACLGCTDLVRRDLDPLFPHLLAQLCRAEHTATPRQAGFAAAVAAAQLDAWRRGLAPATRGATLELDALSGDVGGRAWPVHPECGCSLAAA